VSRRPDVSIVMEWENATLAGRERAERVLDSLSRQVRSRRERFELLLMHDPGPVPAPELAALAMRCLGAAGDPIDWRLEAAAGLHYYGLKNEGASRSTAPLLVFLDSDVIPDEHWLDGLLDTLQADPDVSVVAGNTYIDSVGWLGKAFAAGWFYPLRRDDAALIEDAPFLWANNIVFRRERFLAAPYPAATHGETRDACHRQFLALKEAGASLRVQTAAQARHPAPNGVRHFVVRGLAEGRDHCMASVREQHSVRRRMRRSWKHARRMLGQTLRRCASRQDRARMRMRPFEAPICASIMLFYYGLYLGSAWLTAWSPGTTAKWWRI
jgi:hypothetical protein